MGRKDVGQTGADRSLANARKKQGQAADILSRTARNPDKGRDDALRAGQLIRDAANAADSAISDAEAYHGREQGRRSYELLEEARAFRASLDKPLVVVETLQRPTDQGQQRKLADKLKEKGKDVAKDQVTDALLTRLLDYAFGQQVASLFSTLHGVPLPPGTGKWARGAVGEAASALRQKYQTARSGVDPESGQCTSRRMCHNCRYNSENPGRYRPCMNTR